MCSNLSALLGPETSALVWKEKKKKERNTYSCSGSNRSAAGDSSVNGKFLLVEFPALHTPLTVPAASFSPSTWATKPSQVPTQAHAISWHVRSDNNSLLKDVLRKSFCPPFRSLHWTANIAWVFIFPSASLLKLPQKYGLHKNSVKRPRSYLVYFQNSGITLHYSVHVVSDKPFLNVFRTPSNGGKGSTQPLGFSTLTAPDFMKRCPQL